MDKIKSIKKEDSYLLNLCYICNKLASLSCIICGKPVCNEHQKNGVCITCLKGKFIK